MKDLDIGVCNGVTFKFVLFEPKSLVRSTLNEIARVGLVRKGLLLTAIPTTSAVLKKLLWWLPHITSPGTSVIAPNRPFARWHHFTSTTRILQGFAFLCKLGLSLFKPHWDYKINMKGKTKRIMVVVVKWRHRANGL